MNRGIGTRRVRRPVGARGFTLIELLVAIMAGLLVAAAAVSFSRQSTRFFSQEARIAAAQMSVLAGFQRLQADIARAAYMSTTDMARDYRFERVCAPDYATWPLAVQELTSLKIFAETDKPDKVRISGNLDSSEMFPVLTIADEGGGGHTVYLQENNGPMTRAGFVSGGAGDAEFKNVFKPGRLLRIVDQQGKMEFEVISASAYAISPMIKTVGPLPLKGELSTGAGVTNVPCGIGGFGIGVLANPVSMVEYQIADLKTQDVSPYNKTIYDSAFQVAGSDDNRTELVRNEWLFSQAIPAGETDPVWTAENAPELVAEFAVDLRAGVWTTKGGKLTYFEGEDAETETDPSDDLPGSEATGPTAVRSVNLRLVVRSREADRDTDTDKTELPSGFMLRAPMPNDRFARARTLMANVSLMNHRGDAW